MKAPIHSIKHYKQITRSSVTTVTRNNEQLAIGVQSTLANLENEVREGSIVKAVYVELWTLNDGNAGSEVVTLSKDNAQSTGPTFVEMQALFNYPEKKNILFTHQGLSANDGIDPPMNVMRAWYKIPKSKQRFGLGDHLNLNIADLGANDLNYCGFATYKEYS